MKATKIVYLIHSMVYSIMTRNDPQTLRDTNAQIYLDRELACEKRWRKAINEFEPDVIYAQLYGGPEIQEYARRTLGNDRVIAPSAEWHEGLDGEEYKLRLTESFRTQLAEKGHEIDPDTVELELWGESFEGCAYAYGTALARHLGLKRPPFDNFEMTVPDARFLCNAELVESFMLKGTSVRGYVFNGTDGYPIGFFMDCFLGSADPATVRVSVAIDSTHVQVVNKMGTTLFVDYHFDRPGRKVPLGPTREHEGITPTASGLDMYVGRDWYVLGLTVSPSIFLDAMRAATVSGA